MKIRDKLQNIHNELFFLLPRLAKINVTNFNLLPNQIDKIVVKKNKIRDYLSKSIQEVTQDDLNSVTSIGEYAFNEYINLTSVIIPDSVILIGDSAFKNCTSIASITLPFIGDSLDNPNNTKFGYIFGTSNAYVPTSLKEVIITAPCKTINNYAFSDCTSLTSITIPDSVISIGKNAFFRCTSLKNVYLNSINPPTLGDTGTIPSTTTIHVPVGSGDAYKSATNWSYYSTRIVEDIVIESSTE